MKTFSTLLASSVTMLRRNTALILSSLGLAVISIFAFGTLFGGTGNPPLQLGIVDSDSSPIAQQMVQQLSANDAIKTHIGNQPSELDAMRSGNRDAVIVLNAGFGQQLEAGNAQITVYYNQGNVTTAAITRAAVQSIVNDINQSISGKASPVTLKEQAVDVHNLRTIDFLTPGMLGMMLMWANLGVGTILVTWRQQGIMRRLAATPLRPLTLIGSQMVARLILSLGQGVLLMIIAITVFKVQVIGSWLLLGLVTAVGAMAMLSIGFVIGSFARTPEVASSISFLISFPMMFLGGSYFSVDNAPDFMKPITQALPLTHLNDALRAVINNGASLASVQTDILVLAAWVVVGLLLATRAFRWA